MMQRKDRDLRDVKLIFDRSRYLLLATFWTVKAWYSATENAKAPVQQHAVNVLYMPHGSEDQQLENTHSAVLLLFSAVFVSIGENDGLTPFWVWL